MQIIILMNIKGISHDSIFQISLFSTLADIFAVKRPLLCTKLIHQSSPAEMTYCIVEIFVRRYFREFGSGRHCASFHFHDCPKE